MDLVWLAGAFVKVAGYARRCGRLQTGHRSPPGTLPVALAQKKATP